MVLGLKDFSGYFRQWIDVFKSICGGNGFGERDVANVLQ